MYASRRVAGMMERVQRHPDAVAQQWDPCDLVGPAEIAERLGLRSAATVNQWVRRHRSFPAPIVRLRMGSVYCWPEIERWWRERRPNN